jgi:hypothetical protein
MQALCVPCVRATKVDWITKINKDKGHIPLIHLTLPGTELPAWIGTSAVAFRKAMFSEWVSNTVIVSGRQTLSWK